MNRIVIGSVAMAHWFPVEFNRAPKDIDFAVDCENKIPIRNPMIPDGLKIEYLYNPILFKYTKVPLYKTVSSSPFYQYLEPDLLMTLKLSHLFWDTNWDKHLWDYHFLKGMGCTINTDMLNELIEFWTKYLPKVRRSKLELSKEEFFDNSINDDPNQHDDLHYKLISGIRDVPAFTRILKDGMEVEVCDDKFRELSFSRKKDVVVEETIVMSLERYKKTHFIPAYRKQLQDNIIKHFPRTIALFAIDNYKHLVTPSEEFINRIKLIKNEQRREIELF